MLMQHKDNHSTIQSLFFQSILFSQEPQDCVPKLITGTKVKSASYNNYNNNNNNNNSNNNKNNNNGDNNYCCILHR